MSLDSTQVLVAGSASVFFAASQTAIPTGVTAPGTAWTDCGYVTDAGATFTLTRQITDLFVWQALDPVRKITQSQVSEIALVLRQFNPANLKFVLGGGSYTPGTPGTYVFPAAGENVERAVVIDTVDGAFTTRFYFPRMSVSGNPAVTLARTDSMSLPLDLQSLSGTAPPLIVSNETPFLT